MKMMVVVQRDTDDFVEKGADIYMCDIEERVQTSVIGPKESLTKPNEP